ncbi:protein FAR-RED IMPAIRED RESPONSE 1-like [Nicotiana tabacum]|uniref:Protein FAR-RED IMPAIRED RESPONSE 1-like n=1 Tax=Nicotiana tabacum TaxID=4097 RepID=A0AC58UCJ1_TOBAC
MNYNQETSLEPLNPNNSLETRSEQLRNALYISLGLNSDDSLMSEDEWVNIDSDNNFNDGEDHVENVDDDDDDNHYLEEEEEEEVGEDREMSNELNEEDLAIGPITGMRFSNKDVMFDFYKEHARLSGFCIFKITSNKKGNDIVRYVQYGCDRSRKPRNKHVTKRRNCRARINGILKENGSLRVSKVVKKHNHQLEPALSRLMAGHRSLSKSLKRALIAKDIAGLRPSKNIRVVEVLAGGPENLGCTPKDCRNFILESRKLQLQEGDAQSLLKFFSDMQQKDREFYYSVDVDSFYRLRNIVWVHSHSKVTYEEFHDVICLDTTYLVNQYNMPFDSFVGVNQHRQSKLLGCAFMSSEDITSYKMVLSMWLGALNNVHPLDIMTDQCDSIMSVINALMPNTVHRYCMWHIFAKLPMKLSGVLDGKIAKAEFKAYSS